MNEITYGLSRETLASDIPFFMGAIAVKDSETALSTTKHATKKKVCFAVACIFGVLGLAGITGLLVATCGGVHNALLLYGSGALTGGSFCTLVIALVLRDKANKSIGQLQEGLQQVKDAIINNSDIYHQIVIESPYRPGGVKNVLKHMELECFKDFVNLAVRKIIMHRAQRFANTLSDAERMLLKHIAEDSRFGDISQEQSTLVIANRAN